MGENAVYHIWSNPEDPAAPLTSLSKSALALVRRADVVEANSDLVAALDGVTSTTLRPDSLQSLAALNLVLAQKRGYAEGLLRNCGTTLIRLCTDHRVMRQDVLNVLCKALAVREPVSLGLDGYKACMQVVTALLPGDHLRLESLEGAAAKSAIRHVDMSLRIARAMDLSTGLVRARALAEAHLVKGQLLCKVGKVEQGGNEAKKALSSAASADVGGAPSGLQWAIWRALIDLHLLHGQYDAAFACMRESEALLGGDRQDPPAHVRAAVERALRSAQLGEEEWRTKTASRHKREAAKIIQDFRTTRPAPAPPPYEPINRGLFSQYRGHPALDGRELEMSNLTNDYFMEDIEQWTADDTDYANCRTPSERRLLAILNADRDEVARRLAQVSASLASLEPVERRTLDEVLDQRVWQAEREFLTCVGILQRIADQIWEGGHTDYAKGGGPLPGSVATLRFHGLLAAEVDLLRAVVARGHALLTHVIEPGPDDPDGGTYQTLDPTDEFYCQVPSDEPVDMQVTAFQTASVDGHRSDQWVWEVFYALMELARGLASPLRRCDMISRPTGRLDYLLGVKPSDSPECGTWYSTYRQKQRCDRPACRKKYTSLDPDLEAALWTRAERLAMRRWGNVKWPANPDRLWREALATSDSPQEALKYVEQRLKKAPLKRRPKR